MQTNKEWISIADMMSGLMMVFLFIAIAFMLQVEQEKQAMKEIALTYEKAKKELYQDLLTEFEGDLQKWDAEILKDTTVRFKEPDILFDQGSSKIKPKFQRILDNFFPRYLKILAQQKFKDEIEEIRIEGHTSSIGKRNSSVEESYLYNAQLSQSRSLEVLKYCYQITSIRKHRDWLMKVLRASGLSFSQRILKTNGAEDFERSRRVEFRAITKTEDKIYTILEKS